MSPLVIGALGAGSVFTGAILGLWAQHRLPRHHLTKEAHDIVKLGAGMIATLTALVLGLLVSSAKNVFDSVNTGITQVGAKIIMLDEALAQYGPETKAAREQLKRSVAAGIESLWPKEKTGVSGLTAVEHGRGINLVKDKLLELTPQTEAQRQLLSEARQLATDVNQIRWLLIEQSQNELPTIFLVVLIFWLTMLFFTFGMFAPRNATVISVLFVCACSVSASIFLVLEMDKPVEGIIKVSSAPMRKALEHIGH